MKIYHAPNTRSIRIIWLCEELGLPLEVESIDFSQSYRATPQWRAKSPTGKVPVFEDGDIRIFESGAMLDYILARYGNGALVPDANNHPQLALYRQWCWFAEATLARPLGDIAQHSFVRPTAERLPEVVADAKTRAATCLYAVDGALQDADYLVANQFSGADIMMGYSVRLADVVGLDLAQWPQVRTYYERLLKRPAFKIALE